MKVNPILILLLSATIADARPTPTPIPTRTPTPTATPTATPTPIPNTDTTFVIIDCKVKGVSCKLLERDGVTPVKSAPFTLRVAAMRGTTVSISSVPVITPPPAPLFTLNLILRASLNGVETSLSPQIYSLMVAKQNPNATILPTDVVIIYTLKKP